MNRRNALRNLGLLSGGMIVLPGCDFSKEKVAKVLNSLEVSESEEKLLKNLTNTLIPETDIPGGLSLGLDEFVWIMVDDCLPKDQQNSFMKGLSSFSAFYENQSGETFEDSSLQDRSIVMSKMLHEDPSSSNSNTPGDIRLFLELLKSFTVLGFMRSEYIMTEVMPYSLVPGKYPSCRTLVANGKINIYA